MEARDYLRAIRAAGMTQQEVSLATGIQQPTISKIERLDGDVMSKNYRKLQELHKKVMARQKRLNRKPVAIDGTK